MSAPGLWIFLPIIMGTILILVHNQKVLALVSGFLCIFLALGAFLFPIDELVSTRFISFKLDPSVQLLGRSLTLSNSDRGWLALLFGASAFWFMASATIIIARRLVPTGLVITGLLVASLAVEPFLYASLLIEAAVLISIPMLSPPGKKPGKGILRFLIYQTLALPFILLAGWLLAGLDANPGDLDLVILSVVILGLGFALLLAVFPFYTWIPLLAEEAHPFIAGFILWSFPTVGMLFGVSFLDRYAWLRETAALLPILVAVGVLMVATAGIFALFQRHLGRMMGYAVMLGNGFSLLCLGLGGSFLDAFLLLFIPRLVGVALSALTLANLQKFIPSLTINDLKRSGKAWSFSSLGFVLAGFSLAGMPLFASFPLHQAVWVALARQSFLSVIWLFMGCVGLIIASFRVLVALTSNTTNLPWGSSESLLQRFFIIFAAIALLVMGIFPSWLAAFWQRLPVLFEHIGK
jgi:NADH-quinone oxidoreductase subunit N